MKSSLLHKLLIFNGFTLTETLTYKLYHKGNDDLFMVNKSNNSHTCMLFGEVVTEAKFMSTLKQRPEVEIPPAIRRYALILPTGNHTIIYLNKVYQIIINEKKETKICKLS